MLVDQSRKRNRDRAKNGNSDREREREIQALLRTGVSISYPVCGSKCVHICHWNQFVKLIFYSIPLDRIKCDRKLNGIQHRGKNRWIFPLKLEIRADERNSVRTHYRMSFMMILSVIIEYMREQSL